MRFLSGLVMGGVLCLAGFAFGQATETFSTYVKNLNSASSLTGSEIVPVIQSNVAVQSTAAAIAGTVISGTPTSGDLMKSAGAGIISDSTFSVTQVPNATSGYSLIIPGTSSTGANGDLNIFAHAAPSGYTPTDHSTFIGNFAAINGPGSVAVVSEGGAVYGFHCVVIGNGASCSSSSGAPNTGEDVVIGHGGAAAGSNQVVIGSSATTAATSGDVAIGFGSSTGSGGNTVAIGEAASVQQGQAVGVGGGVSIPSGNFWSTAIGYQASVDAPQMASVGGPHVTDVWLGDEGSKVVANGHLAGLWVSAPVTKTADYTTGSTDISIIFNCSGSCTLTLPAANNNSGRILMVRTIAAQTVVSAISNVVPAAGGAAGTAILAATAGKWAILQSDGSNWQTMAAN